MVNNSKRKKKRTKLTFSLNKVRLTLFVIWLLLLSCYMVTFWYRRSDPGFSKHEIDYAVEQVLMLLGPILAAFSIFWLGEASPVEEHDERVPGIKVFAVFIFTIFFNGIVLFYVMFALSDLNFPENSEQSFVGITKQTFRYLALVSAFITAPVAFVLKRPVTMGNTASLPNDTSF